MTRRPPRTLAALLLLCVLAPCSLAACGTPHREGVTVLGTWTGAERDAFEAVLAGFTRETGIRVAYTGDRDARAVLASELHNGHPPNAAVLAGLGDLRAYAAAGALAPLTARPPATGPAGELTTTPGRDGRPRRYGVLVRASVKSLIWFNPAALPAGARGPLVQARTPDALAAAATALGRPWCLGLADGSASGWPGTDWIEDFLLHRSGLRTYDAWAAGNLAWTSPPVREAWRAFGSIVAAGAYDPLQTGYAAARDRLFTTRPGCRLAHAASYVATLAPVGAADFVPFPGGGAVEIGGDFLGVFRPTAATRRLVDYLASARAQRTWAGERGGGFSPDPAVPPSAYPDDLTRRIARTLTGARAIGFDASDAMPTVLATAFHHAVLEYAADPTRLDTILTALETLRRTAH